MDTAQYIDFIRDALKAEGILVADTANKIALDLGRITVAQYSAAAQLIAAAYLNQKRGTEA